MEIPNSPLWHEMDSLCDSADRLRKEIVWTEDCPNMDAPTPLTKGQVDRLCHIIANLAYSIKFSEEQRVKRAAYQAAGV